MELPPMGKIPTLKDVAKRANVSTATVSNVLNGTSPVGYKKTQAVLNAIKELGYRRNENARSLKMGTSGVIGVIVPDYNPLFMEILTGIEKVASENNWNIVSGVTHENIEKQDELIEGFLAQRVEGLIIAPVQKDDSVISKMDLLGTHTVYIDRRPKEFKEPYVGVNNYDAALQATNHLIEHGHKKIALIHGIEGVSTTIERKKGFMDAMIEAGLNIKKEWLQNGESTALGGYAAIERLLSLADNVTAVVVANDFMCMGAWRACKHFGINIPNHLALIGFDDSPWAELLTPGLTVVRQPGASMGEFAVQLIKQQKEGENELKGVVLETELIIRESCGCVQKRDSL